MFAGRLALVLLWLVVAGSGRVARPEIRLSEHVVVRLPVGPAPEEVSDRECAGDEGFCSAGFAFPGQGDTLYFYDLFHDNLKVMVPLHPGEPVAVLPGIRAAPGAARPLDGMRGADGCLYLLTTTGGPRPRRQTWRREVGGEWRPATRPVEWRTGAGSGAIPAGEAHRAARGILLGVDRLGNRYYEKRESWAATRLEMYDAGGRLVAASDLPERPIWKAVSGRGEKWVAEDGGVFEMWVSERWLVVTRWVAAG